MNKHDEQISSSSINTRNRSSSIQLAVMRMNRCFSVTASRDRYYKFSFIKSGLRAVSIDLSEGTVMHCWIPGIRRENKPNLLLVHGFGANAMWQFQAIVRNFAPRFNIYVPDLVFFGGSYTTRPERSENFQAWCLARLMEINGVSKTSLVGISYGGFVGYSLAYQCPPMVEKLVLCASGISLEEKDLHDGLFKVSSLDEAADILMPQTPDKLRELMRMSFVKPTRGIPSIFLSDFISIMCSDHVSEKKQLIRALLNNRKLDMLPRITQPTSIIWGDQDQIFPVELAHRLQRHIGENAQLVIVMNAGHAINLEKPKEFIKQLKRYLITSDIIGSDRADGTSKSQQQINS